MVRIVHFLSMFHDCHKICDYKSERFCRNNDGKAGKPQGSVELKHKRKWGDIRFLSGVFLDVKDAERDSV